MSRTKIKFVSPLHGTFCKHAIPLKKMYILVKGDVPSITLESLSNIEGLFQVKRHTYRKYMIKQLGCEPEHFKRCGKIVNNAEVKKITRPSHGFFLDELVERVENGLGSSFKKGYCSAGFQPAVCSNGIET